MRRHLRYCLLTAGFNCKENRHPQKVMRELGIEYQISTPQSLYDCWQFWNCSNIPEELPAYLTAMDIDPQDCVGHGLTEEMADALERKR
jgi:hypothetical protein